VAAWQGHLTLVGQTLPLIWNNISSENLKYKVCVLRVKRISMLAIAGAVGGLNSNPTVMMECLWDLLSITNP
jgi:hypothetical protein